MKKVSKKFSSRIIKIGNGYYVHIPIKVKRMMKWKVGKFASLEAI